MNATLETPTPTFVDTSITAPDLLEAITDASSPITINRGESIVFPPSTDKLALATVPGEGGPRAWLVVLGSFLIHSIAFAPTEYIFGIFELHYQTIYPNATASSIAFVGTTGSAVTYLAGFLTGIVADRFGFRVTAITGSFIMTLSFILASFANQLWQLYLTQGVLFGIGASLAYYPAIAAPSHYFTKKRGLATGLAVSGVGAGGLILAPVTNTLIEKTGIYWTLRILALLCFVVCGGASLVIVERKGHIEIGQCMSSTTFNTEKAEELDPEPVEKTEEKHPSFFEALKVFKDPQFLSLSLAELAASIGILIPLYYMQTYAVFIGVSAERGALILGLSNGASFAGRILLGLVSDYVSNAKILLLCSWCTAFAVMVVWTVSRSFGGLLIMGLTFGFFAGGYVSLVPVAVAESFGTRQMASTIGLMYAAGGLGMIGGAPLGGFLLDINRPNISYLPVTLTAGGAMTLGALGVSSWAYFNGRANLLQHVKTMDTL